MLAIPSWSWKLVRADEHWQALDDQVAAFLQVRPYEVIREEDIPAGKILFKVNYRQDPPPALLMLIGDAIQNMRSSLDHIAWALAGGIVTDTDTEFPIFKDSDSFHRRNGKSGISNIDKMPTAAQGIIQSLQPYNGRHGPPDASPLWILQGLNNRDKDRTINLMAAGVIARIDVRTHSHIHSGFGLFGSTGFMPFKNGTTIYEILISCNASQVEDYSDVTFDRAFDPEGPGRGSPVRDGLSKMRESVNEAIDLLIPRIP